MDLDGPVALAPRVWWVGSLLPGDAFQCHVYLIEQGDRSVLIDPGSALNSADVIRKVDEVVGVRNIRWVVCSHADPDIIGALPALTAHGLHPDAAIVTHWRDEALIVHSGTQLPYWRIEEHGWRLPLEDRTLRFVFTPYAHFAGAFCTFDEESGVAFTSDLFGGFSEDKTLFASSVDYFDAMRAFHEHYMPNREVLVHAVEMITELPVRMIAPQHGQVIPEHLVGPITDRLARLECGIYLLARDDPGLQFLLTANRTVRDIVDTLVEEPEFAVVAKHLAELAAAHLAADRMELWSQTANTVLQFSDSDDYAGHAAPPPAEVVDAFSGASTSSGNRLVIPLRSPTSERVGGAAVLEMGDGTHLDRATQAVVEQVASLVEAGLEREVLRRVGDLDRAALYEQATHDPLTGLFNRHYLADAAQHLCAIDDRRDRSSVAALMIDVDHFKNINDSFGHPAGDLVLQRVAAAIAGSVRAGDVAVRFGGEEFLVLLTEADAAEAGDVAERIRSAIAGATDDELQVTASVGVATRHSGELPDQLVARADAALYSAKESGRDRVVLST